MTPISLSDAYSNGQLTQLGHCARAGSITLIALGVLLLLTAIGLFAFVVSPPFEHVALWVPVVTAVGMMGSIVLGVLSCGTGAELLMRGLSNDQMKRFVQERQEPEVKKEEIVEQKPFLHRMKSKLCCFHQVIKEGSFQTF